MCTDPAMKEQIIVPQECVAVCCSVLQYIAVLLQYIAVYHPHK